MPQKSLRASGRLVYRVGCRSATSESRRRRILRPQPVRSAVLPLIPNCLPRASRVVLGVSIGCGNFSITDLSLLFLSPPEAFCRSFASASYRFRKSLARPISEQTAGTIYGPMRHAELCGQLVAGFSFRQVRTFGRGCPWLLTLAFPHPFLRLRLQLLLQPVGTGSLCVTPARLQPVCRKCPSRHLCYRSLEN